MALSFHLSDAQHERFLQLSSEWVAAQCEEDMEPEGAGLLFEYSVYEQCWVADVRIGSRVEELGPVRTTESE